MDGRRALARWRRAISACIALSLLFLIPAALLPETPQPLARDKAAALFKAGQYEEAVAILTTAIEECPDDPRLHYERARCLNALERLDEALADLDRAIALDPDFTDALGARGVLRVMRTLPDPPPTGNPRPFDLQFNTDSRDIEAALRAIAHRDFEAAIDLLNILIDRHTEVADLHHCRAVVHFKLGRTQEAFRDLSRAFELDPTHGVALATRAAFHLALSRLEEAQTDADAAIAAAPAHPAGYSIRAVVAMRHGHWDEALSLARLAVERGPENHTDWKNMAICFIKLQEGEKALQAIDEAIRLYEADRWDAQPTTENTWGLSFHVTLSPSPGTEAPNAAEYYLARGMACMRLERWSDARTAMESAVASDPRNSEARCALLLTRLFERSDEDLLPAADALLEDFPDQPHALRMRGIIHYRRGDWNAAVRDWTRVLVLAPEDVEARYARAAAYGRRGSLDLAREELAWTIEQDGRSVRPRALRVRCALEQGDIVSAVADLSQFWKMAPPRVEPTSYLRLLDEPVDLQREIDDATTRLDTDPQDALAAACRAGLLLLQGETALAGQDADRAVDAAPDNPAHLLLRALIREAQGRDQAAVEDLNRLLQDHLEEGDDGLLAEAFALRGAIRLRTGPPRAAKADVEQALQRAPERGDFHLLLGDFHAAARRPYLALGAYTRAVALNPGLTAAYVGRSVAFEEIHALGLAVRDMSSAIEIEPAEPAHYLRRAQLELRWGYLHGVETDLAFLRRLAPESEETARLLVALDEARRRGNVWNSNQGDTLEAASITVDPVADPPTPNRVVTLPRRLVKRRLARVFIAPIRTRYHVVRDPSAAIRHE